MKNSELQGLFILDHNGNCIQGIAGCNGVCPFVLVVFSLCAMFLQKANKWIRPSRADCSFSCSWRGLGAHRLGGRGKELEPAVHRGRLLGGTGSRQNLHLGGDRVKTQRLKRIVQSFMQSRKFLIKLKTKLQQTEGKVVYELLKFLVCPFLSLRAFCHLLLSLFRKLSILHS